MKRWLKNWLSRNKYKINEPISLSKPGLIGLLLLLNSGLTAQTNLVPNPSFEIFTACPSGPSQLHLATPWTSPVNNDADYFNSCSSTMGVPSAIPGVPPFQFAKTGEAYAGIFLFNDPGTNYREYLQVALTDTLENNNCYYVRFYTNRYENTRFSIGSIGLTFSNQAINSTGTGLVLNLNPDIYRVGNPVIDDTINWISIEGIYNANGNETYITIGNFYDDNTLSYSVTNPNGYPGAGYLIDEVSVIEFSTPTWIYPDTNITIGDSVFIGNLMSGLNCTWYLNGTAISNAPGFYVSPTGNSSYIIEMNICGNLFYDTVNVNVQLINVREISTTEFDANIYPNPTPGEFTLELPKEGGGWQVIIKDMEGRTIMVKKIAKKTTLTRLITEVENGVYLVYITNSFTNATVVKKLVIQK